VFAQSCRALARLPAGPALEGGARGVDRGLGVVHGCARDRGDLVLGRGIENVETAAVGGFAPFAADPQIGRNVSKKVVVSRTHGCDLITHESSCASNTCVNGLRSRAVAAYSMYSPPPCGEGLGVGVARLVHQCCHTHHPPSPALPHKGGGSTPSSRRILCIIRRIRRLTP